MGSRNKFGWLSIANVTSHQKVTETSNEIPLRLVARAFSSLFAQKKFDWRLAAFSEMTYSRFA